MRFVRSLAFLAVLFTAACIFAGCKKDGFSETPMPDTQQTELGNTVENEADKGKTEITVTDTFYPQYTDVGEYDGMKAKLKKWFDEALSNGTLFRAELSGTDFGEVTKRWVKDISRNTDENGHEYVTAVFTDEKTSMRYTVEATLYNDYPTVDYVVWAENISKTENSPVIEELYGVYSDIELECEDNYMIHTANGSTSSADDFKPFEASLYRYSAEEMTFSPSLSKGLSSDGALPYFDVIGKDCGILLAVGWTGIWEAAFSAEKAEKLSLKARQYYLNASLFPEEKIRSPRIVLTYFDGGEEYGHNVWRKLVIEHYTPNDTSKDRFVAPLCINFWGGIRESYVLKQVKAYREAGIAFDAVWFDAGWNSDLYNFASSSAVQCASDWAKSRGWWTVNENCFPSGSFKNISDLAHSYGKSVMVWWMIEDAVWNVRENWTLGMDSYYPQGEWNNLSVLKLCDDAVLEKLIDYYDKFFEENGVDWIRVDTGTSPYWHWATYDSEIAKKNGLKTDTRLGVSENKHILNYYKLWDTLAERHPGFVLDNCASGGRRLDIEMTKRGIPLWRTDYDCNTYSDSTEARQAQTQWLSKWIPLSASYVIGLGSNSSYQYRSCYSAGGSITNSKTGKENLANLKKIVDEYVRVRPYWYGSYYQILAPKNDKDSWQAYELFREDMQKGMLVITRRENAHEDAMIIKFKGLSEGQKYLVHSLDDEKGILDVTMTGKELMEKGLGIAIPRKTTAVYEISIVTE